MLSGSIERRAFIASSALWWSAGEIPIRKGAVSRVEEGGVTMFAVSASRTMKNAKPKFREDDVIVRDLVQIREERRREASEALHGWQRSMRHFASA